MSTTSEIGESKPKRVLVADDERAIARLLQVTLQKAGYDVTCAYDGRAALEQVTEQTFDLVVLDVMMPHYDGYQVLRQLRKTPGAQNTRVVMLTAKTADSDVYESYRDGADLYLPKPFEVDEVLAFVRRLSL